MRLVERMTMTPNKCLTCGAGNVEGDDGEIGPFIDLEVEVGWGDSVYICPLCTLRIALLSGFITPDDKKDLEAQIANLEGQVHDLGASLAEKERRLSAISEGRKAIRKEREEREKVAG